MAAYRLLALDMDGTVLTSDKHVSPRTRQALRDLCSKGVALALATGRNVVELSEYREELSFVPYGVLASGAIAYHFAKREVLLSTPIPTEAVLTTVTIALEEGGIPFLSCVDGTRARKADAERLDECGLHGYRMMYEQIYEPVEDLAAWVAAHPGKVVKLDIYHVKNEGCLRIRDRIVEADAPIEVWSSEPGCMECTALGVNKSVGLRALAERLGIAMEEIVAVGDGGNDLAMLKSVGMPVAMGNASREVCDVARLIVADNDHDGIVELIDRLF
ncbi:MAG: HAD family phosphatase [Atopobiaceae bacterium]|nr:HAD family phosphatase [Atopobiaceae bacterium]